MAVIIVFKNYCAVVSRAFYFNRDVEAIMPCDSILFLQCSLSFGAIHIGD